MFILFQKELTKHPDSSPFLLLNDTKAEDFTHQPWASVMRSVLSLLCPNDQCVRVNVRALPKFSASLWLRSVLKEYMNSRSICGMMIVNESINESMNE